MIRSGEPNIAALPAGFSDWTALLDLINAAFAYMDGVIDPPSSAKSLTSESLKTKASRELCLVALRDGRLAGCVFADRRDDCLYIGKLAISPDSQGKGIGRRLIHDVEAIARTQGLVALELQTRIELTGNQTVFKRLGFHETARTAHAGFSRPTSITMRKLL